MTTRREFLEAAAALALTPALRLPLLGEDVTGPVRYAKAGVEIDGRLVPWKSLASLTETDPDPAKLKIEQAARGAKAKTAAEFAALGRWSREQGLEEEARAAFTRAIELDPDQDIARKGLSFARDSKGWRPATELLEEQRKLKPMAFSDWCRDHALPDEEWKVLVERLVADAWDKEAIPRMKARVERRPPETLIRPPFAGRWKALVDTTNHHQIKVFAVHAIDWVKVDESGKMFRNSGKALEDYFGFGEPVLAPADGVATWVEDTFKDVPPGRGGKFNEANGITIQHVGAESSFAGHLKQGSATIKSGEKVAKGQVIGRVGNSGASGLPHCHFTMQIPVQAGSKGGWIGVPPRFGGFRLVDAGGTPCSIDVKAARPQEGWILDGPKA